MTTAADDRAVEEAFEASLAGRPVREGAAGLVAFTSAVRGAATQPGRPNAVLADLLSTGLLTDQSSPSTRTAPAAGSLPSRRTRSRTRRRFTVIVPALIAKFLSAGALAQAATGAGVVVVVAAGAGVTGALPDGAQTAFSGLTGINRTVDQSVGDSATAESAKLPEDGGSDDPTLVTAPTEGVEGELVYESEDDWASTGPENTSHEAFKAWLAEGAENGWVDGEDVSKAVRARNDARALDREKAREAGETEAGETEAGETEAGETEIEADEDEVESLDEDDTDGSGNGNDNRNGAGKGRSGN